MIDVKIFASTKRDCQLGDEQLIFVTHEVYYVR